MIYSSLAVLAAILCLYVAYTAAKYLFKNSWILGWLRGMFGLLLLGLAILLGFIALDVFTYRQIQSEEVIATLSFEKQGEAQYRVTLVDTEGAEKEYELRGDQWQLDARIVKWDGPLSQWGLKPGYRLDRISGRYYSLEKERTAPRTVYAFNQSHYGIDIWRWLRAARETVPMVDAVYGSATYLPMADGALFEVSLSGTGLVARPMNEPAKDAIGLWEE